MITSNKTDKKKNLNEPLEFLSVVPTPILCAQFNAIHGHRTANALLQEEHSVQQQPCVVFSMRVERVQGGEEPEPHPTLAVEACASEAQR